MPKKYFCTFADSRMEETLVRIRDQAERLDFFDVVSVNTEHDLDPDFREEFKGKLVKGTRGYGYWVWKPQILLQTLRKMDEDDILLYADAGCHLNKGGVERLREYFDMATRSETGLLTFQEAVKPEDLELTGSDNHLEKFYSKGDIFDFFSVRDNKEFYDSGIVAATAFVLRKCDTSQKIIESWLQVFRTDFSLVDNSESKSPNFEGFIENRHDQSIFSMLCKTHKVMSISAYEMWQQDWSKLETYPIWAKRDKKLTGYWLARQKAQSATRKMVVYVKTSCMSLKHKLGKLKRASNKERIGYLARFSVRMYVFVLPFVRIFLYPFAGSKERLNIVADLKERITNAGPAIRYRYYFGYKLFYSCSKDGTGIVNHVMGNRTYEKETCEILEQSLKGKERPAFIDVGANIGLISIYLLHAFPNMRTYAFEPSPHQNMLLGKTIEANSLSDRITLSNRALSDTEGTASFFTHNEANCSGDGFRDTGRGGAGSSIQVEMVALDTWWEQQHNPNIDLIKIDTEGAELMVLKGAKNLLTHCSPDIFFEMQENNYRVYGYDWQDMLSFLGSIGYTVYTETNEELNEATAQKLMASNYNFIARKA